MNLSELLLSDIMKLPISWEKHDNFESFINKSLLNYLNNLKTLSDFNISPYYSNIETLCDSINKALEKYSLGLPIKAYELLDKGIIEIQTHLEKMYLNDPTPKHISDLYRIRIIGNSSNIESKDLFHIPFELRHIISTQRYSIPGFPCLYFGSSIYICWEELNRPDLNSIVVNRAKFPSTGINILDFAYRPNYIGKYLLESISKPNYQQILDYTTSYLNCWPLIFCSSIKVKHIDGIFKPEYIVPQLLLQWIRNNPLLTGIRYFSMNIDNCDISPPLGINYVIPIQTISTNGFCSNLMNLFHVTKPLPWSLVMAVEDGHGSRNMSECIKLSDKLNFTYEATKFGLMEYYLSKLDCNKIV
ncbi:MAG: hypothetical protein KAZ87_09065 [Spirochaetes bacterium]|nr:hypothetical protein [Spirochaetota bacterium]